MKVRTRFAPSPTGLLHIGGVRTALYCYAMARANNGTFVLRIEDTDQERYSDAAVDEVHKVLTAYGLEPDESDRAGGDFGPYTQSKRLDLYKKYAEELIAKGWAYKCFLTPAEAEEIKLQNKAANTAFRSPHRDLTADEVDQKEKSSIPYVIRFKTPLGREINYTDGVQGEMHFETDFLPDQVLLKSDGFPTYHLAMLVDDHLMEITHVFRGFEWIPSIPLHVLLYEAIGWQMPAMYHLSTILDPEGGKLSKRKGAVAAMEFIREGYLPQAVLNFLMLLGWSSPLERVHGESERELFSLQEFVDLFNVKDLNKSNPVFNREKLLWFNKQYLQSLSDDQLSSYLQDWLQAYPSAQPKGYEHMLASDTKLGAKLELVKSRADTLQDVVNSLAAFYEYQNIDWEIKQLEKVRPILKDVIVDLKGLMSSFGDDTQAWQHPEWEAGVRQIADKLQAKHGDVFMVLRVAVWGAPVSPPLFETLQVLGKQEVLRRLGASEENFA